MFWFFSAILAYFLLGIVSFGDRFLLVGSLPNPKLYAFFIGIISILVVPIFLFFGVTLPQDIFVLSLGLASGVFSLFALLPYFQAIARTEVSRVVPAVGAFVPIFTFLGSLLIGSEFLSFKELIAFFALIVGGFLISTKRFSLRHLLRDDSILLVLIAALLFSLWFLTMKIVFDRIGFISGFILVLLGRGISALLFLSFREVRDGLFRQKIKFQKSVIFPLVFFQSAGGIGVILQSLSISFAKVSQVPLINALEGTRYLFLFLFVWLASKWRPRLLKEEMQGQVLLQKIFAGLLIISGISLLALGG